MNPDIYSKRLLGALMVSCLLHAALVFMPYLGTGTAISRLAVRGAQGPGPARVLNVRLVVLELGAADKAAEDAAAAAGAAGSPAQRKVDEVPRPPLERAQGIGLLPIPAPTYYTTDQLTKRPQPTSEPRLEVPEIGPIFASGKVILKIWINELGKVDSVDVEKSDLAQAIAATAAAAFARLHFVPGELNGRPVGTMMRIEVTYDDGTRPPP
jgi:TonB family protein